MTSIIFISFGLIFTLIGTIMAAQESSNKHNNIISLNENIDQKSGDNKILGEENKELAKKNIELSKQLGVQAIESEKHLTDLSKENTRLTIELTALSTKQFNEIRRPEINITNTKLITPVGKHKYFEITVHNTGKSTCQNVSLFIDSHNAPMVDISTIQNWKKVPSGLRVQYKINLLKTHTYPVGGNIEVLKKQHGDFVTEYYSGRGYVSVSYHLEYEWEGETYKTKSYNIFKKHNEPLFPSMEL